MPRTKSTIPDDPAIIDQLNVLFESIEQLTEKLGGLKDYQLDNIEKQALVQYLQQKVPHSFHDFIDEKADPLHKQKATIKLMQSGAEFVEASVHYRKQREEQKRLQFLEECRINNIPLTLVKDLPEVALTPADCSALHDWPEHRQAANGVSGRLENAGQFIQRLFDDRHYDTENYGELFMSDLKHINSSLYQALAKWQSRTGKKLLKTKREEIDQLLEKKDDNLITFQQASQVRNARWRRKVQKQPTST